MKTAVLTKSGVRMLFCEPNPDMVGQTVTYDPHPEGTFQGEDADLNGSAKDVFYMGNRLCGGVSVGKWDGTPADIMTRHETLLSRDA